MAGEMKKEALELYEGPGCRHRDYVLAPYRPLPARGPRLHSATAFRLALEGAGLLKRAWPLAEALRSALGEDETVWGVTSGPDGVSAELYFYNNALNPRGNPKSAARVRRILAPHVSIAGRVPEDLPYFMCSLDLSPQGLSSGRLPEFKVYLGSSAEGPCGYSYRAEESRLVAENHYHFYRMPGGWGEARDRLKYSPRGGAAPALRERLAPRWLKPRGTVCYAVKPLCDAFYFSRVSTAQAVRFGLEYGSPFGRLLAERAKGFSHLLWDVSFNFRARRGRAEILKTGLYGVL